MRSNSLTGRDGGAAFEVALHACCCPCTLEPLRLLLEEGHDIAIAYMNSNIHPAEEYEHRRAVLLDFAA